MAERSVEIRVTVDDAGAVAKLQVLRALKDSLAKPLDISVDVNTSSASARLAALIALLDKVTAGLRQLGDASSSAGRGALALAGGEAVAAMALSHVADEASSATRALLELAVAQDVVRRSGGFSRGPLALPAGGSDNGNGWVYRAEQIFPEAAALGNGNDGGLFRRLAIEAGDGGGGGNDGGGFFSRLFGRLRGLGHFGGFGGGGSDGGGGGFGGFLGSLGGFAGRGLGALQTAAAGGGGGFTGPLIGTGIAAALALAPSVLPFLLGGGLGGLATFAGFKYGASALSQQATLQQAIQSANPGAQRQQAREALAQFNQQNAAALAFGRTGRDFTHIASQTLLGALTKSGPGFSAGPHGQPGGSFLQGIQGIVAQLGNFVKNIGPQLGQMFRASLPFVSAFVRIMEQFTKAVMPALTQMMRQFTPILPIMIQGFKLLAQGIAGFIRNLGPGMKSSAIIFKAAMMVIKGVLQLVGAAASLFANAIVKTAEFVRKAAASIPPFFDRMKNDVVSIFHSVVSFISSAWNTVYTNTINWVKRIYTDAVNWFHKLPSSIKSALMSLPGILFGVGVQALTGLLHGLESMGSSILGYLSHLAGSIASTIANAIPGGGLISGAVGIFHKIGMASGGTITEPIIGRGLRTGTHYTFGEGGIHEQVTPLTGGARAGGGGNLTLNINGVTVLDDSAALKIIQAVRTYKIHNGNVTLGIA